MQKNPWEMSPEEFAAASAPAPTRAPGGVFTLPPSPDEVAAAARAARDQQLQEAAAQRQQVLFQERNSPKPQPIPSGFRPKGDGTLEPIPGGPADPANKPKPMKALRESDGKSLEGDVGTYAALKRAIGGFNDDYAGNPIGGLENAAQRLTGIGTQGQADWWADFRSTDNMVRNSLFGATLSGNEKQAYEQTTVSPSMRPELVRKNLQRRAEIIQEALSRRVSRFKAAGYNPEEIDAALGEFAPDFTVAKGATRNERDADTSQLINTMIRRGATADEINAAITPLGFAPVDPAKVTEAQRYAKANPGYKGSLGEANRTVPTTTMNRVAASPLGSFIGNAALGVTAGLPAMAAGPEGRTALKAANEANPGSSLAGQAIGGVAGMLGAGSALRAIPGLGGAIANSPRAASLAGDIAYGGTYGGATAEEGQAATGALTGAIGGVIGNRLGAGLTSLSGRAVRGVQEPALDYLRSRGVPLTMGQIASARGGGAGRAIGGLEEAAANTPVIGALINPRRAEGLEAYNRAEFADAGAPIGFAPTGLGAEGVQQLATARSQAYSDALDPARLQFDAPLIDDLNRVATQIGGIPNVNQAQDAARTGLASRIAPAWETGELSGRQFQEAYRGLARTGRERANGDYGYEVGQAMRAGQDALAAGLETQNPSAFGGFLAANASNRNLNVIADAVSRARGADEQVFTPAQMTAARAMSDGKLEGKLAAATGRLRQTPLTETAQRVLPNKTPPTGVNAAPVMALLGGASYAGGEATDSDMLRTGALLSALALPYTRTGRSALEELLLRRPQAMVTAGNALVDRAAPTAGLAGRAVGGYIGGW